MKEAYIIDGIRTPIGNYKGTLSAIRTDDLGALVISEIVKRNSEIPKDAFDDIIFKPCCLLPTAVMLYSKLTKIDS